MEDIQFKVLESYLKDLLHIFKKLSLDDYGLKMSEATERLSERIEEIKLQVPSEMTVDGSVTVSNQINLQDLKDSNTELIESFKKYIDDNKIKEVSVKDIDKVKIAPEIKVNIEHLTEVNKKVEELLKRDFVKLKLTPEEFKNLLPREPKDAIPVVLTDKSRRQFYDAIAAAIRGSGGPSDKNEAIQVQEDAGDANIEYVGFAPIGTLTSAAAWRIMKIDETTGTVITWADGNDAYDNVYDDREALGYS